MNLFRRRNYYIDKKFQTKYLLLTIVLLLVYTLTFVTILFFPSLASLSSPSFATDQVEAARTLLLLHAEVWPAVGISILILGVVSIFVTHKVAGPVYRIRTALTEISSGDLTTKIRLRKWDDLQELAVQVNRLKEDLQYFTQTLESHHADFSQQLAELEKKRLTTAPSEEGIGEVLDRLNQNRDKMAETLKQFRKNV